MRERRNLTVETLSAVAAENAGHPLDPERAATYAEIFEPMLQQLESLRKLPIKDIEPAVVFRPIEAKRDD